MPVVVALSFDKTVREAPESTKSFVQRVRRPSLISWLFGFREFFFLASVQLLLGCCFVVGVGCKLLVAVVALIPRLFFSFVCLLFFLRAFCFGWEKLIKLFMKMTNEKKKKKTERTGRGREEENS